MFVRSGIIRGLTQNVLKKKMQIYNVRKSVKLSALP